MIYALCVAAGLIVGGILAWVIAANRVRKELSLRIEESERRANTAEGKILGLDVFDPERLSPDRNGFHRLPRPFFKTHCLCCQDLPYAKCFEVWVYCRESLVKMASIPMTGFSVPA